MTRFNTTSPRVTTPGVELLSKDPFLDPHNTVMAHIFDKTSNFPADDLCFEKRYGAQGEHGYDSLFYRLFVLVIGLFFEFTKNLIPVSPIPDYDEYTFTQG